MSSDIPPQDEDPVRVAAEIRWPSATATVEIPDVLVYSSGVYFAVHYATLEPPPPDRPQTPQERRQAADEATRLTRIRHQLTEQIRVNGAGSRPIHGDSTEAGFTAWYWTELPAAPADLRFTWSDAPGADVTVPYPPPGTPATPARDIAGLSRIVRTYYPPRGEDPVVVRPDIRWQNPTATVTIPEVFFYSAGVYLPVTYRPLVVPPAPPPAETEEERNRQTTLEFDRMSRHGRWADRITVNGKPAGHQGGRAYDSAFTYTAWIWIDADGTRDPLRVQLNWPEFPGADATVPYPPPGAPTTPAPDVPQSWADQGDDWGQTTAVLRGSRG